MWKIVKGCVSISLGAIKLTGKGLREVHKGVIYANEELDKINRNLDETKQFRNLIHEIKMWKYSIEFVREKKPSSCKNQHQLFSSCDNTLDVFSKLMQLAIDNPVLRNEASQLIKDFEDRLVEIYQNDYKSIRERLHSTGLEKNAPLHETLQYYFLNTANSILEVNAIESGKASTNVFNSLSKTYQLWRKDL